LEVFFHDGFLFRRGPFEKSIAEGMDEIKIFGHSRLLSLPRGGAGVRSIPRRNPVNDLVWMSMFVSDELRRAVRESFFYYSLNVHELYKSSN
jgi:hypothetical protein